jgi:predicted nucleotidyltransferase
MPDDALVSVDLPVATRDRLAALAAARGESVAGLIDALVQRFVADKMTPPQHLDNVVRTLRSHEPKLRERGVTALWVFGSVARGEAVAGSDVDLLAELEPKSGMSLVGLASLRAVVSEWLGVAADVLEAGTLKPAARVTAEREAVRVF